MARPQKQTVDYFPHDANASQGDTLTILQGKWGNDGYAFWFRLLEKLSSAEGHFIDCRNPVKWQLLLAKTQLTNGTGEEIMNALTDLDAIDTKLWREHRVIWCQKLVDNISEAYRNRRRPTPTKPVLTNENPITTPDNPHTKLNYTKLNKTKDKYGEFSNVLLTNIEYQKLKDRFPQADEFIEELSQGIKSHGYKYKDHYATIIAWQRRKDGKAKGHSRELPTTYMSAPTYPD